ncbi:phage tail assembly protein T [Pandoraea soli]
MGRTVAELEANLTSSEWLDWLRFFAIEPYGTPLTDVVQAQLRSMLANIHRNDKARPTPFDAREFLLFMESAPAESEAESKAPERINGLTPGEWQLALYLRSHQERLTSASQEIHELHED